MASTEMQPTTRDNLKLLLLLTLPLYVLDQVTKLAIYYWLMAPIAVIPGVFNLVYVENTGAAFGMLKDNNWFFLILSIVATVVLIAGFWRGWFPDRLMRIGAALLLAGVLGNMTDRIWNGAVIDFLDVILPWYGHWPAFNVADSCICIAAGLFMWNAVVQVRSESARTDG